MAQVIRNYQVILVILTLKSLLLSDIGDGFDFSVQPSLYFDNNIYEKIHQEKTADQYLQLLVCGKYKKHIRSNHFNLQYLGNWQTHRQHSLENKLYNRLNFNITRQSSNSRIFFLNGYVYQKNWFLNDRHYTNGYGSFGVIFKLTNINYQVDLQAGNYRFSYFPEFDNNHLGLRTKLIMPKSRYLTFNLAVAGNYYLYQNNFIDRRRFDSNGILTLGFEYRKNLIVGAKVQALHQMSNYDFLVNNSLIISPYLSAEVAGFYTQLLAKYQFKQYLNKITNNQISLVYPDPESNVNNQIFFAIEREIRKNLSLSGKVMFFSSEYKYQADFYEKLLIGVGIKYGL